MKWFSSKPSPAELEALESQKKFQAEKEQAERKRKLQWVKNFTAEQSIPAFDDFYNQLEQLCSRPELLEEQERNDYQKSLDGFNQIRIMWFKINVDQLEESEGVRLHDSYFAMLSIIQKYKKKVMQSGFDFAWGHYGGYASAFGDILEAFTNIHFSQDRRKIAMTTTSHPVSLTANFPLFVVTEPEVKSSLERLNKLWAQAHEKEVSVENEYFLEQMISSYLPEAYRLYDTFKFAPDTLRISAAKLFQEQIGLMEEHLIHILADYMQNNLNALQAQVTFLKEKTALSSTDNRLELTAVPSA